MTQNRSLLQEVMGEGGVAQGTGKGPSHDSVDRDEWTALGRNCEGLLLVGGFYARLRERAKESKNGQALGRVSKGRSLARSIVQSVGALMEWV